MRPVMRHELRCGIAIFVDTAVYICPLRSSSDLTIKRDASRNRSVQFAAHNACQTTQATTCEARDAPKHACSPRLKRDCGWPLMQLRKEDQYSSK